MSMVARIACDSAGKVRLTCDCNRAFIFVHPQPPTHFPVSTERFLERPAAAPPLAATVTRKIDADAVYGTFVLLRGPYVAVVTRSSRAALAPNGKPIQRVLEMEWLLVGNGFAGANGSGARPAALSAEEDEEEATYLRMLSSCARDSGLYFSLDYDLTQSVQRNDAKGHEVQISGASAAPEMNANLNLLPQWFAHCDERFLWNRLALRELVAAQGGAQFTAPFISGFVGASSIQLDIGDSESRADRLLLLSRRAVLRQGFRFIVRGADNDGNVANYAETEQILQWRSGAISSYVQTRGSIPLIWDQPATCRYTPTCVLAPLSASLAAFSRHAAAQVRIYGRVTAVNLIDQKGDQLKLGRAYEDASSKAQPPPWRGSPSWQHVWFDFHHECRKMKWENLSKLLEQVRGTLTDDGFFFSPAAAGDAQRRPRTEQVGVVRTNCMDNLDRTNVVQSIFARAQALAAVPGAAQSARSARCSVLTSPFPVFESTFNALWADNADALSRLYSGTGALKTDFTRTGKRTLRGALNDGANSVARYVLNNFVDGRKQDALDLFLGRFVPERVRGIEGRRAARPHKLHLKSSSPVRVLSSAAALWLGLTIAMATIVPRALSPSPATLFTLPTTANLLWGGLGALVSVFGMANLLIAKGVPAVVGRALVCKPTFISPDAKTK